MNRHNLAQADLLSTIALDYAKSRTTEPPWYGFFGIILRDQLTRVEADNKVVTFFVPQLPITAELDDDIDDDDINANNRIEEGYESPTPTGRNQISSSPDPLLLQRQSVVVTPYWKEMSVTEFRKFRSTRIPDFVRLRCYLDDELKIKATRIDLVVEQKSSSAHPFDIERRLDRAAVQAQDQALHALVEDERLTAVGYIAAVGNVWQYGEVRGGTKGKIVNTHYDATYSPSLSGPSSTSARESSSHPTTPTGPFERSPAPSPETPGSAAALHPLAPRLETPGSAPTLRHKIFGRVPKVFTDPTSLAQKTWLADIHARLNNLDMEMAPSYT